MVSRCLQVALLIALSVACSKKEAEPTATPAPVAVTQPVTAVKCEAGADGTCKASSLCSPSCEPLVSAECAKCEAAGDCNAFPDNCESPLLSPEERATCYEIYSCVQKSNCFDGSETTLGSCYCGKLDTKKCLAAPMSGAGSPDGVCRDVILKGMPNAKTQSHVLGNFTTRTHAAGLALSRLNCQKIGYKRQCSEVCGFGAPPAMVPDHVR